MIHRRQYFILSASLILGTVAESLGCFCPRLQQLGKHEIRGLTKEASVAMLSPCRRCRIYHCGDEVITNNLTSRRHFGVQKLAASTRGGGNEKSPPDIRPPRHDSDKIQGRLVLLLVAFLYGTLNVSLRGVYSLPDPPTASVLSAVRGWLAAACFLPLLPRIQRETTELSPSAQIGVNDSKENSNRLLLLAAVELAWWNFLSQGLINEGLLFTESARASFLAQTSVLITPFISMTMGERVGRSVWIGCFVALAGLILLMLGSGKGAVASAAGVSSALTPSFRGGDLLVLGGAASWSIYIVRTCSIGSRFPELSLQFIKSTLLAVMYSVWLVVSAFFAFQNSGWDAVNALWLGWQNIFAWALLAYSAVGPGALADVLQQQGQKKVSASEANVILCSEPIFTALLAFLVSGEVTSPTETAGGGLILLAASLASTGW